MPYINGGGGGGAPPFNGGTITTPLVVSPTADVGLASFDVIAASGANIGQLETHDQSAGLYVDSTAGVTVISSGSYAFKVLDTSFDQLFAVRTNNQLGLFGHTAAAQPTLTSGTATPEQIALALQSYGAAGGT